MTAQDRQERRRLRWRVASGVMDFFGIAFCTFLILGLFMLLINLYGWVRSDIGQTFAWVTKSVTDAVINVP